MLTITFRGGRLAPHPEDTHPRIKYAQIRTGTLPLPVRPSLVDYVTKIASWPMYGNDQWGDCVWAAIGHIIEAATTYGQGTTVQVTDSDVIKGYSDVTGFDPHAGPPGSNPTDQGTVIQDALNYWRKVGVGGHKILAFAEVDVKNADEVAEALYLFGHLEIGINFPDSAMQQFNDGQPWDVVPGAQIEGGHAVNLGLSRDTAGTPNAARRLQVLGKNRRGNWEVVTWGRVQEMTPAFWDAYVEEAWITITPEWCAAAGGSPEGIDTATLGVLFTQLTGEPSPFGPAPAPGPPPSPTPAPVPDDVVTEIKKMISDLRAGWDRFVRFLDEHGL